MDDDSSGTEPMEQEAVGVALQPFGTAIGCKKCGNVDAHLFKREVTKEGEIEYLVVTCNKCKAFLGNEMTLEATRERPRVVQILSDEEKARRDAMPNHGDVYWRRRRNTDQERAALDAAAEARVPKTPDARLVALERTIAELQAKLAEAQAGKE